MLRFEEPMERRRMTAEQAGEILALSGGIPASCWVRYEEGSEGSPDRSTGQALPAMHFPKKRAVDPNHPGSY